MILYRILSVLLLPLLALFLCWRALQGKEKFSRLGERFAFTSQKFSPHKTFWQKIFLQKKSSQKIETIWIHAVSVGETNSSLILVEELLKFSQKIHIVFTTTTLTSAAILASKINGYKGRVIHQFLPLDCYFTVRKFLKYWQPKKAIFVESEIWPNFIEEARKLGIATVLVNARISKKSFSRWKFAQKFGINIFNSFSLIFAQSEEDKNNLQKLTTQKVRYAGNLKAQASVLQFDKQELQNLKTEIGQRKFWLAASTHKGEEEIIFAVHKKLQQKFSDILTIIVPRHPQRALEIKGLASNLNFAQRSAQEKILQQTEIYLADTLGELGLFYALNKFAFLGGSLVEVGGHNPFEPAQLRCAIITGNFTANNQKAFDELISKQSCVGVKNVDELFVAVQKFLEDELVAEKQADRAFAAISIEENIAQKIVEEIMRG